MSKIHNLYRRFLKFVTRMDARAARAIGISLGLFVLVGAVFVFGKLVLDIETGEVGAWFESFSSQWYALPVTILIFTVMSFIGAPQFALMAAAVLAFGPTWGFLFAWVATMVSASANYALGRVFGADILKRYGGDWANRMTDFVGRNGVLASMIVRWVPSGPFIIVNMGFGVARTPYWAFLLGLALGSAPKIVIVAFAGQSILDVLNNGNFLFAAALGAAVIVWIGIMLVARAWLRARRASKESVNLDSDTEPEPHAKTDVSREEGS